MRNYLNRKSFYRSIRFYKKMSKYFLIIRRLRFKLSLNKNKFEELFLFKLSKLIGKYYGKKVQFNIVNLKYVAANSDIFTEILTLKLKKEQSSPMNRISSMLARVFLPEVNGIIERGRVEKQVDFNLIENKFKNLNLISIMNNFPAPNFFNNKKIMRGGEEISNKYPDNVRVYADSYKDNLNQLLYNLHYKNIIGKFTP